MADIDNNDFHPVTTVDEVDYDRHEPKSGIIFAITVAVHIVLAVMIVGIYWLYVVAYEHTEYTQYTGMASKELQEIHDRENEHLHRYTYVDKDKGVVRIPIDRAMDILATDFAAGKVSYNTASYPVKVELPGGAAGGANPPAPGAPGAPAPAPAGANQTNTAAPLTAPSVTEPTAHQPAPPKR